MMCNATDSVNDVWEAVWITVVSEILKHMNNIFFKEGVVDVLELFVIVSLILTSVLILWFL